MKHNNPMRRMITIALVLALTVTPCKALTLFYTDYDSDTYKTETIHEDEWLPLVELSKVLPYEVKCKDRTVYVHANRTFEIEPDWWIPPGVKIQNGVTYVTQSYMRRFLPGISFMYNGELYAFNGEITESKLVRGDAEFRKHILTVMYRLKLALPDDYDLIRSCLTGGIEQGELKDGIPQNARAYVYPSARRPIAHIIEDWAIDANLAELISHEAYHVHLERNHRQDESKADEYGLSVKERLMETK